MKNPLVKVFLTTVLLVIVVLGSQFCEDWIDRTKTYMGIARHRQEITGTYVNSTVGSAPIINGKGGVSSYYFYTIRVAYTFNDESYTSEFGVDMSEWYDYQHNGLRDVPLVIDRMAPDKALRAERFDQYPWIELLPVWVLVAAVVAFLAWSFYFIWFDPENQA